METRVIVVGRVEVKASRTVVVMLPHDDEFALRPLVVMLPPAVLRAEATHAVRLEDAHQCGRACVTGGTGHRCHDVIYKNLFCNCCCVLQELHHSAGGGRMAAAGRTSAHSPHCSYSK